MHACLCVGIHIMNADACGARSVGFFRAEVTDSCKPLNMGAGNQTWSLCKSSVCL